MTAWFTSLGAVLSILATTFATNALAAKELHYQCKLGKLVTEVHLTQVDPPIFTMSSPDVSVIDAETGFIELKRGSLHVRRFPDGSEELGWVFYLNRTMGAASFRTFNSLNMPIQVLTGSCKRKP